MNRDHKVVRENKVAVLYSPGFGAGWSTWNTEHKNIVYDPTVIAWVESGKPEDALARLEATLNEKYPRCYLGGMRDLEIQWLPLNTWFIVEEYDGSERIVLQEGIVWKIA
jgi:hypothetical protein